MARARNIKPGFFVNDELVELPFEVRLLFIGLWTIADKEGRLADRPKKIKMEIFPADNVDCDAGLAMLAKSKFLRRYEAGGEKYIQIVNWNKHQNPHIKETPSVIPAENGAAPGIPEQAPEIPVQDTTTTGTSRADSLNLIPDSRDIAPQAAIRPSKGRTKKTPLPDGFTASSRVLAYAAERGCSHIDRHVENFVSYVKRNGKTYADWDEALITAIRDDWAKVGDVNSKPKYDPLWGKPK